jgi:hypothetical protein
MLMGMFNSSQSTAGNSISTTTSLISSDEEHAGSRETSVPKPQQLKATKDWNDIPSDFLKPPPKGKPRASAENAEERRKKNAQEWDDWGPDN